MPGLSPRQGIALVVATVLAAGVGLLTAPRPAVPSPAVGGDAELAARLRTLAGSGRVGVSVALIEDGAVRLAGIGETGTGQAMTPTTRFEIGSVAKTLTAALYADLVAAGEVRRDATVRDLLPDRDWPAGGGGDATLEELAGQRSGLPRVPLTPRTLLGILGTTVGGRDPDIGTPDDVLRAGATAKRSEPGRYRYSNLGFALLGHTLAEHVGRPYPELLRDRVLRPAGLTGTTVPADPADAPRDSAGHDRSGRVIPSAVSSGDAPAGAGVWSTAAELARFADLVMRGEAPGHDAARPRFPAGDHRIGYAWHTTPTADGGAVTWHNGRSGGYTSFLGFDPDRRRVVAVLNNTEADSDGLGMRLLTGSGDGSAEPARWHELAIGAGLPPAAGLTLLAAVFGSRRRPPDRAGLIGNLGWLLLCFAVVRAVGVVLPLAIAGWTVGAAVAGAAICLAGQRWRGLAWNGARRPWPRWIGSGIAVLAGIAALILVLG